MNFYKGKTTTSFPFDVIADNQIFGKVVVKLIIVFWPAEHFFNSTLALKVDDGKG